MDFNRLIGKGKKPVEDRGGTDALKQDAQELADVAKGDGSLTDKGKAAAAAIREPGAPADAQKPPTN
jgi:hypothetical protein